MEVLRAPSFLANWGVTLSFIPISTELARIPEVEIGEGYWKRAGSLRAKVLSGHHKARFGDALIAQCCIEP